MFRMRLLSNCSASRMTATSASSPFRRSGLPTALLGTRLPIILLCSRIRTAALGNRAGSGNLNSGDKWNFCLTLA